MSNDVAVADRPDGPLDRLARWANGVAGLALLGLVGVQGWQVFARYVINDSPSWTEPVTVLLLSTAMSLAAAACVHGERHFSFNLLAEAAGPGMRRAMAAATQGVIVVIGLTLAVGAWRLWLDGLDVRMAGAAMPQSITFLPLALGGALMALFGGHRLLQVLRRPAGGEG